MRNCNESKIYYIVTTRKNAFGGRLGGGRAVTDTRAITIANSGPEGQSLTASAVEIIGRSSGLGSEEMCTLTESSICPRIPCRVRHLTTSDNSRARLSGTLASSAVWIDGFSRWLRVASGSGR